MEININSDLGEKSIHYSGKNDLELLKIINSANIACGYHAGDSGIIDFTIKNAKNHDVDIGAHPGFDDLIHFGRKKIYLDKKELINLIYNQLIIIDKIAKENNIFISHVKPHGALNNMACLDLEIAETISETIKKFNKDLILIVLPVTMMEKAAQNLDIKFACEIYADRNYDDSGHLLPRNIKNSVITDAEIISKNILEMINESSINALSGNKIKCNIDSVCIHGDNLNALSIASKIKSDLLLNGIKPKKLDEIKKFN